MKNATLPGRYADRQRLKGKVELLVSASMDEEKLRVQFWGHLGKAEVVIYSVLALLLFVTAIVTAVIAGIMLWDGVAHWIVSSQTLQVLDQLLVVLMLVEILHTVRISIRSHILGTKPFLVVGLVASIRRILVITSEAATLTKGGVWSPQRQHFPRQHDRTWLVGSSRFYPCMLHYVVAPLCPRPGKPRERVTLSRGRCRERRKARRNSCR